RLPPARGPLLADLVLRLDQPHPVGVEELLPGGEGELSFGRADDVAHSGLLLLGSGEGCSMLHPKRSGPGAREPAWGKVRRAGGRRAASAPVAGATSAIQTHGHDRVRCEGGCAPGCRLEEADGSNPLESLGAPANAGTGTPVVVSHRRTEELFLEDGQAEHQDPGPGVLRAIALGRLHAEPG